MDHQNTNNSEMNNTSSHSGYSDPNALGNTFPPDLPGTPAERLKHSGPGISSFIVGLVALLGHIATFVLLFLALNNTIQLLGSSLNREDLAFHPAVVLSSLAFLVCLVLNLSGVLLGIIGLVLKNRRKVFAIIGLILNALFILLFVGLILREIYLT